MTPASELYPVLFECAALDAERHPAQILFLQRIHHQPLDRRLGVDQLLFTHYWGQIASRLFERHDTTAHEAPLDICLPWFADPTQRTFTRSYQFYYFGQVLVLQRQTLYTALKNLNCTSTSQGRYLDRGCVSHEMALTLYEQLNLAVNQSYRLSSASFYHRLSEAIQIDDALRHYAAVFVDQFHLLRVLAMWLKACAALQEVDNPPQTTCDECSRAMSAVPRLRQCALDNLCTLSRIIREHLRACGDAFIRGQLVLVDQGSQIETNLCRAQVFEEKGELQIAAHLYADAQNRLAWEPTRAVRALYEKVEDEYGTADEVDYLQLAALPPTAVTHNTWNITGTPRPTMTNKRLPWMLTETKKGKKKTRTTHWLTDSL